MERPATSLINLKLQKMLLTLHAHDYLKYGTDGNNLINFLTLLSNHPFKQAAILLNCNSSQGNATWRRGAWIGDWLRRSPSSSFCPNLHHAKSCLLGAWSLRNNLLLVFRSLPRICSQSLLLQLKSVAYRAAGPRWGWKRFWAVAYEGVLLIIYSRGAM